MEIKDKIRNKIQELISSGNEMQHGNGNDQIRDNNHSHSCISWLTSAQNTAHLIISDPDNAYRINIDKICDSNYGLIVHRAVGEVCSILQTLLKDIDLGLLSSIENQTRAIVLDDFLDHAKEYVKKNKPNEAGVISGVVFEDTLRTICRINNIEEAGNNLDSLINDLTKKNILSQTKAKRAKVAAHVRTKATHAQWDEFELNDVKTTIIFIEELILVNLENEA